MDKNIRTLGIAGVLAVLMLLAGCISPAAQTDPTPDVVQPSAGQMADATPRPTDLEGDPDQTPQPNDVVPSGAPVTSPVPSPEVTPVSTASPTPDAQGTVTPSPSLTPDVTSAPDPTPGQTPEPSPTPTPEATPVPTGVVDSTPVDGVNLGQEAGALSQGGAAVPVESPVASGDEVKVTAEAEIDYSNAAYGYVMVRYNQQTTQRLKAQVKGPTTTYTYNLTAGVWAAFPLSDGNGTYQITVYKNVADSKYAAVISQTISVSLINEFAPFLHSNQYVNYAAAPNTVAMAAQLTAGIGDPLLKVEAIYNFVVREITYDTALAASVSSGYLPHLDSVLARRSGICFDYAAMMTGMLRSQGVPCKLVVGYAGSAYHAWISVWSPSTGWIDGVIFFNGSSWQRMDPTFASSGNSSEAILQYIGNGSNYAAKYFY